MAALHAGVRCDNKPGAVFRDLMKLSRGNASRNFRRLPGRECRRRQSGQCQRGLTRAGHRHAVKQLASLGVRKQLVENRAEKAVGAGESATALAARDVQARPGAGERHVEDASVLVGHFIGVVLLLPRRERTQVHRPSALAVVEHAERTVQPSMEATVQEHHVGLQALGFVYSHHLHSLVVTLQALHVPLVARRQPRAIDIGAQGLHQFAQSRMSALRLFLQDLE